jgi:hypothetical protein
MKFLLLLSLISFSSLSFAFECSLKKDSTGEILDSQAQQGGVLMIFHATVSSEESIVIIPTPNMGYKLEIAAFSNKTNKLIGYIAKDRKFGSDDYDISLDLPAYDLTLSCNK